VHRLPVVDGDGILVGIVSRSDLLKTYLCPDSEIRCDVLTAMAAAGLIGEHDGIAVTVEEGIVDITGAFLRRSTVDDLIRTVRSIDGVVSARVKSATRCRAGAPRGPKIGRDQKSVVRIVTVTDAVGVEPNIAAPEPSISAPESSGPDHQDLLQFFYQCPIGLIEVDNQGVVARINPAAVRMPASAAPVDSLTEVRTLLGRWFGLSAAQQRLLIACGAGAGLGCVYNVPLGGAFFTAEILVGSVSVATMLPALACSSIATITAWVYLPNRATYLDVPSYHLSATFLTWSVVAGPLIGLGAAAYIRVIGWLSHHRLTGIASLFAPLVAFGVLGVIGIAYPQLFGNGQDMAHDAFLGRGALALLLALAVLKPAVTALCLAGGASGGLFTPVLSTGAVLGGGLGLLWSHAWPGTPVGAYAIVGAAAMIGCAIQAPITGLALVLELTHSGFGLMPAMILATVVSTAVVRYIDGYSIYSARLPAQASPMASPTMT
jgi:CBS domain-containing protein